MYWKIFTYAGKPVARMDHTLANLDTWGEIMEDHINRGIRVFCNVYSNKGVYIGPLSKIKPEK
jgi:hypothetical protein